jgi:hypothetical protein
LNSSRSSGVDRPAVRPGEHDAEVLPLVARGGALFFLLSLVLQQVRDERGGIGTELRPFFVLGRVKVSPPFLRSGQALACFVQSFGHGFGKLPAVAWRG